MNKQTQAIIDASIQLENDIANLYSIFYATFEKHTEFWWHLHLEERNHASLIKTIRDYFEPAGVLPDDLLHGDLQEINHCSAAITNLIQQYDSQPPDETEAFNTALAIEKTVCEAHYQHFMTSHEQMGSLFRRLNQDDKDHYDRIKAYMESNDIPVTQVGPLQELLICHHT